MEPEIRHLPAIIRLLGYLPIDPPTSFPQKLRAARLALGMSQARLATRLGLDPGTIMRAEQGKRSKPSVRSRLEAFLEGQALRCGKDETGWRPGSRTRS